MGGITDTNTCDERREFPYCLCVFGQQKINPQIKYSRRAHVAPSNTNARQQSPARAFTLKRNKSVCKSAWQAGTSPRSCCAEERQSAKKQTCKAVHRGAAETTSSPCHGLASSDSLLEHDSSTGRARLVSRPSGALEYHHSRSSRRPCPVQAPESKDAHWLAASSKFSTRSVCQTGKRHTSGQKRGLPNQ